MKAYGYIVRWEPSRNGILAPEQTWEGEEEEVVRWKDFLGWNPEDDDDGCFEALVVITEDVALGGKGQTEVMLKGIQVIAEGVEKLVGEWRKNMGNWCVRLKRELKTEGEDAEPDAPSPKFKVGDVVRLKDGKAFYLFGNTPLRDMKIENVWEARKGDGSMGWRYRMTIMKIDGMSDEMGEYVESKCFDLGEEQLEKK